MRVWKSVGKPRAHRYISHGHVNVQASLSPWLKGVASASCASINSSKKHLADRRGPEPPWLRGVLHDINPPRHFSASSAFGAGIGRTSFLPSQGVCEPVIHCKNDPHTHLLNSLEARTQLAVSCNLYGVSKKGSLCHPSWAACLISWLSSH